MALLRFEKLVARFGTPPFQTMVGAPCTPRKTAGNCPSLRPLQENEFCINLATLSGATGRIVVDAARTLGDVQRILVNFAGASFPACSASLASGTTVFTEFHEKPFELAQDEDTFTVTIAFTTDPSFYAADARYMRECRRCGWPSFEDGAL
jgi:hypothetical protein